MFNIYGMHHNVKDKENDKKEVKSEIEKPKPKPKEEIKPIDFY